MDTTKQTRAAQIAQGLNKKMAELAKQGLVDPSVLIKPVAQEKDTPEMRAKRQAAVAKLRTFLD